MYRKQKRYLLYEITLNTIHRKENG